MKNIELTAVFEPCDEGGYIAYLREIQGINTQGESIEEAKENLADAVNLPFLFITVAPFGLSLKSEFKRNDLSFPKTEASNAIMEGRQ